ncbi:hypothetical protein WDW86_19055 [Bdellovibrionota bacterium FG-2]
MILRDFFIAALLCAPLPVYSSDNSDCPCRDSPLQATLPEFGNLAVDLSERFSIAEGNSFTLSPEEYQAFRFRQRTGIYAKNSCPEKASKMRIIFRPLALDSGPSLQASNPSVPALTLPDYKWDYYSRVYKSYGDCLADPNAQTPDQCQSLLKQTLRSPSYTAHLRNENLKSLFEEFGATRDSQKSAIVFDKFIAARSDSDALKILSSQAASLSTPAKLAMVQKAGALFVSNYDNTRAKAGSSAQGVVSLQRIRQAAQNNEYGYTPDPNAPPSVLDAAGICRDIASAQGKMLTALGFSNTYIISVLQSQARHSVLIAQGPSDAKKYYKFNYDTLTSVVGQEGSLLSFQGKGDATMEYEYYLPDGRLVQKAPSELGKVLREASGFSSLSAFSRPTHSLGSVQLDLGNKTALRLFQASDRLGNQYVGGALNSALYSSETQRLQVGAAYAYRNSGAVPDALRPANLDALYFQLRHFIASPYYKVYESEIKARIEASTDLIGGFVNPRNTDTGGYGMLDRRFGSLDTMLGLRLQQGDPKSDKFTGAFSAKTHFTGGKSDVRAATSFWAYPIEEILTVEGRMRLSSSPEGRAFLVASTSVLLDYFGPKILGEIGYIDETTSAKLRIGGRVDENTPALVEGTLRYLELMVSQSVRQGRVPINVFAKGGIKETASDTGTFFYGNSGFEFKF